MLKFVILLLFTRLHKAYWTYFSCKGDLEQPWAVDYSDHDEAAQNLQDLLYSFNHDCQGGRDTFKYRPQLIGIGSSFAYTVNEMVGAFSRKEIFRPTPGYIWADTNKTRCTTQDEVPDCYFLPLSPCGIESSIRPDDYNGDTQKHLLENVTAILSQYDFDDYSICSLGKHFKKSVQWIFAQFLSYLLRYREDIDEEVRVRVDDVFQDKSKTPNSSVIAVHARAGNPYDLGRHLVNLSTYIEYVDMKAEELAKSGRPVVTVYLCSHLQHENIVSSEHMAEMFPSRSYNFKVINHTAVENTVELEDHLLKQENRLKTPLRQIFVEYLADIEILARADVFIGVTSNVYPIVAALRIAHKYGRPEDSCYIASHSPNTPLRCENDTESHDIWYKYFGKLDKRDPGHGFANGTPF